MTLSRPESLPRCAVLPGTLICVKPTGASAAAEGTASPIASADAVAAAIAREEELTDRDRKMAFQFDGAARVAP
jgi:hypothetical protein